MVLLSRGTVAGDKVLAPAQPTATFAPNGGTMTMENGNGDDPRRKQQRPLDLLWFMVQPLRETVVQAVSLVRNSAAEINDAYQPTTARRKLLGSEPGPTTAASSYYEE